MTDSPEYHSKVVLSLRRPFRVSTREESAGRSHLDMRAWLTQARDFEPMPNQPMVGHCHYSVSNTTMQSWRCG